MNVPDVSGNTRGVEPLTVAIGPLRVTLMGLDLPMSVAVRSRYARFLVAETDGALRLTIGLAPEVTHQPGEMPLVERVAPRRYTIEYGALSAELDLAGGVGSATLLPTIYQVDSLLRITMTLMALERDAFLLHGSGVWLGGRGSGRILVCFGPSGVGKTTVARGVPPNDVLCDEMMLLFLDADGEVRAAGTPFHGDLSLTAPGEGEAVALVRLQQAEGEQLTPLGPGHAGRALLSCLLFFCCDEELAGQLLDLALRIGRGRTYTLDFNRTTVVPRLIDGYLRRNATPTGEQAPRETARG